MVTQANQPEAVPDIDAEFSDQEAFLGLLSGVANHEAKLAVSAIILHNPSVWFSASALHREVMGRQGEHYGWKMATRGPVGYCEASLAPIGLVARGQTADGPRQLTAYKANDERPDVVELGHAMSGALLDWSLEFPDISLQQILGVTAKKGPFRTPEVRYNLYRALVEHPRGDASVVNVVDSLGSRGIDTFTSYQNVEALTDKDILQAHTLDIATDMTLEIVDPIPRHDKFQANNLNAETVVVYGALQALWQQGKRQIGFDELVTESRVISPDIDVAKLRQAWSSGASKKSENMPGLRLATRSIEDPRQKSTLAINPSYEEAILELVVRLDDIAQAAPDAIRRYISTATAIINDQPAVSKLFAKAKAFSSTFAGQNEAPGAVEQRVASLFTGHGSMSVKQVTEALAQLGKPLSRGSVIRYLGQLTDKGALTVSTERPDPSRRRRIQYFSLPQES